MPHHRGPAPDSAGCGGPSFASGQIAILVSLILGGASASWAAAPAPPPLPVDVTGATVIEFDGRIQQYTLRGPRVIVVRGDQRLEAPEVLYGTAGRRVVLPRGGTVSTPVMELSADRMLADLVSRHVEAEGRVAGRFLDQGLWTSLTAVRVVADDRPGRRLAEATGNVVAVRQDQEIHGDRFVYDRSTLHGAIEGHALVIRGQDSLRADRIDADLETREARATGHVLLDRAAQMVHASAEEAAYSARTETAVLAGHPIVMRGRDSLSADQITMRLAEDLAAADGHVQIVGYPEGIGP